MRSRAVLVSLAISLIVLVLYTLQSLQAATDFYKVLQNLNLASSKRPEPETFAICVAAKDQAKDLPEFFIHHFHHTGARRFYIMDDGSSPPLAEQAPVTGWGIPSKHITFHKLSKTKDEIANGFLQLWAYDRCHELFGARHRWMAFIDVDEFIEYRGAGDFPTFLSDFEQNGAIGINWEMHTSNNHTVPPSEGVRKGYTTCITDDEEHENKETDNALIKSIVNTRYYKNAANPHAFFTHSNTGVVGEHHDPIAQGSPFRRPITRDFVSVHHYALKSRQEFEAKVSRGNAMKDPKGWDFYDRVNAMRSHPCTSMAALQP